MLEYDEELFYRPTAEVEHLLGRDPQGLHWTKASPELGRVLDGFLMESTWNWTTMRRPNGGGGQRVETIDYHLGMMLVHYRGPSR